MHKVDEETEDNTKLCGQYTGSNFRHSGAHQQFTKTCSSFLSFLQPLQNCMNMKSLTSFLLIFSSSRNGFSLRKLKVKFESLNPSFYIPSINFDSFKKQD